MIEYVGMLAAHHETFLNFPLEHLEGGGWQHEVEVVQQQLQEVMIKNQRKFPLLIAMLMQLRHSFIFFKLGFFLVSCCVSCFHS